MQRTNPPTRAHAGTGATVRRAILVAVTLATVAALGPTAPARADCVEGAAACDDTFDPVGPFSFALYTIPTTLIFGIADVAWGLEGEWLPDGWAWPQLVIGGLGNLALGTWGLADPDLDLGPWVSSLALGAGAWFAMYAVVSLARNGP